MVCLFVSTCVCFFGGGCIVWVWVLLVGWGGGGNSICFGVYTNLCSVRITAFHSYLYISFNYWMVARDKANKTRWRRRMGHKKKSKIYRGGGGGIVKTYDLGCAVCGFRKLCVLSRCLLDWSGLSADRFGEEVIANVCRVIWGGGFHLI